MKLRHIYIANAILVVLVLISVLVGLAGGSANGLVLPFMCLVPLLLFVSGGSVFATLYSMKDKKLIDASEYSQLKAKQQRTANIPLS